MKRLCTPRKTQEKVLSPGITQKHKEFIINNRKKWVNGTRLKYFFFDNETDGSILEGTNTFVTWKGSDEQKQVVRDAFDIWKQLGIGLSFEEVFHKEEAQVRIGFMIDDGSWSYVGRDVLNISLSERTMNFGWDISVPDQINGIGTALHEIGHTIGLEHEHQSNNAGIIWNEEAVFRALEKAPNFWPRQKTFDNIIKKVSSQETKSSQWDPESIMQYPFEAGLILQPEKFQDGLFPPGTLSPLDIVWVHDTYPAVSQIAMSTLIPSQSVAIAAQKEQQQDFYFIPTETRYYDLQTFGKTDNVMVLFEQGKNKELTYLTADDNTSIDQGSKLRIKLFRGKEYVIKVRMIFKQDEEKASIMIW